MCMIDDGDAATISSDCIRRARKEYACGECGRTIKARETYRHASLLYDGHWSTFRTCRHCVVAQDWLAENCGGWVYDSCFDEMVEHAREYPPISTGLLRIAVGMKRKWQRFDGAGLLRDATMPLSIASTLVEPVPQHRDALASNSNVQQEGR